MKVLVRIAVVVVCFFAAIACYMYRAPAGGAIFILAGLLFEGAFWIGVFGVKSRRERLEEELDQQGK